MFKLPKDELVAATIMDYEPIHFLKEEAPAFLREGKGEIIGINVNPKNHDLSSIELFLAAMWNPEFIIATQQTNLGRGHPSAIWLIERHL
jgi:hypothetical protein